MQQRKIVTRLLSDITKHRSLRGTSLVISVFGDAISQHGGSVWLGSLIDALEPLGVNERLVRTSVFRLVQEKWLEVRKIGRRSYYSFTDYGNKQYARASRRIYAAERPVWDHRWTLVLSANVPAEQRDELRKSLAWQGFGQLAQDLYAHPTLDHRSLDETLREMELANAVVVWQASTEQVASKNVLKQLVLTKWGIADLEQEYRLFLTVFQSVLEKVRELERPDPGVCFQLRTLLIHEYRRILLKDPDLPMELLPSKWSGSSAQQLTATLYGLLGPGAEIYIRRQLESADGNLPMAAPNYYTRFGMAAAGKRRQPIMEEQL